MILQLRKDDLFSAGRYNYINAAVGSDRVQIYTRSDGVTPGVYSYQRQLQLPSCSPLKTVKSPSRLIEVVKRFLIYEGL